MKKHEWVRIHKALSNENRLEILRKLWGGRRKHVTGLSRLLDISIMSTSRNLGILERQGILKATGKKNRVFYYIDPDMPPLIRKSIAVTLGDLRNSS